MVQKNQVKARGRPKSYDRSTAIRAMRDLFWEKGYAATTLDDLSHVTQMNRPSLYNAFGDKAQIFKVILDDYVSEIRPLYEAAFKSGGSLFETLTAVYETAYEIYLVHDKGLGCFLIGAALTDSMRDPEIAHLILDRIHAIDRGFVWLMKSAQEKGQLPSGVDPGAMAMLASSIHNAISVRVRAGENLQDLRAYVNSMVKLLVSQPRLS